MWLQGGPFLEISLLIQEDKIYKIITRLSNHKSVSILEENLEDKINQFEIGYLYDEQDSSSNRIHSTSINILANIQCKRKSVIYISKVAKDTILLNFCFFGSEFDAPEWGQLGIKKDEYHYYINYLSEMLEHFHGYAGAVAIENDVLGLISETQSWPDNIYSYKEINPSELLKREYQNRYIGIGVILDGSIQTRYFVSSS